MRVVLKRSRLFAFAAIALATACATPEVPGTYEAKLPAASGGGERHVSVTLDPSGAAAVSTAFPGRPSRSLVQGTWVQKEGGFVIVTLRGPRTEQIVFQHGGDELIARDWDRSVWGQTGPGTLRRKQP
jgi:hypothetical protein